MFLSWAITSHQIYPVSVLCWFLCSFCHWCNNGLPLSRFYFRLTGRYWYRRQMESTFRIWRTSGTVWILMNLINRTWISSTVSGVIVHLFLTYSLRCLDGPAPNNPPKTIGLPIRNIASSSISFDKRVWWSDIFLGRFVPRTPTPYSPSWRFTI